MRALLADPGATRVHLELPSFLPLEGQQARRFGGSIRRRVGGQPLAWAVPLGVWPGVPWHAASGGSQP
jgi:hypothetical protein